MTHTEWMKIHNWPPGFKSRMPQASAKFVPTNNRANGGFDRNPIGLQGAIPYVIKGPVENMERK